MATEKLELKTKKDLSKEVCKGHLLIALSAEIENQLNRTADI